MKMFYNLVIVMIIVSLSGCVSMWSTNNTASHNSTMSQTEATAFTATNAPQHGITKDGLFEYEILEGKATITGVLKTCKEIVIPEKIDGCFVSCIGALAFYQHDCTSIIFPQSLESIQSAAFYRCDALSEITIPNGVTFIANDAFFRTSSLRCIHVQENNTNYSDIDGVLYNIDKTILITYPEGRLDEQYKLPDGLLAISDQAFGYAPFVKRLIVPKGVLEFPDQPLSVFWEEMTLVVEQGSYAEAYALTMGMHVEYYSNP